MSNVIELENIIIAGGDPDDFATAATDPENDGTIIDAGPDGPDCASTILEFQVWDGSRTAMGDLVALAITWALLVLFGIQGRRPRLARHGLRQCAHRLPGEP